MYLENLKDDMFLWFLWFSLVLVDVIRPRTLEEFSQPKQSQI